MSTIPSPFPAVIQDAGEYVDQKENSNEKKRKERYIEERGNHPDAEQELSKFMHTNTSLLNTFVFKYHAHAIS